MNDKITAPTIIKSRGDAATKIRTKAEIVDGIDPKLLGGFKHGKGDWKRNRDGTRCTYKEYNDRFDKIFKQGKYAGEEI